MSALLHSPSSNRFIKKDRQWRPCLMIWTSLTLLPLASLYVMSKELADVTSSSSSSLFQFWYNNNEPRFVSRGPEVLLGRGAFYKKTENSTRFFMDTSLLIGWEESNSTKRKRKSGIPLLGAPTPPPPTTTTKIVHTEIDHRTLSHEPQESTAIRIETDLGYIADAQALRRGRDEFLKHQLLVGDQQSTPELSNANSVSPSSSTIHFPGMSQNDFHVLADYENKHRIGTRTENEILTSDYICAFGPGRGMEQDAGYKLITEKVQVHQNDHERDHRTTSHLPVSSSSSSRSGANMVHSNQNEWTEDDDAAAKDPSSIRILCAMYSYSGMRDLARTQALLWGHKCDGFVVFSNETIPSLGMVDLEHIGEESYNNMWQKTRSIWKYIYDHYMDEYDYFHLGGDDLYVIVENLRHFLTHAHKTQQHGTTEDGDLVPLFFGQWVSQPLILDGSTHPIPKDHTYMVSGGPGYTLNSAAVRRFVEDALPTCHATDQVAYEDKLMSKCLRELGILGQDTRDEQTGEQQYHDTTPSQLYLTSPTTSNKRGSYHSRMSNYWQGLEHPIQDNNNNNDDDTSATKTNNVVGPKYGMDAAATHSVSFHDLYTPTYVARIHALIYHQTCPIHTPLGRALSTTIVTNK